MEKRVWTKPQAVVEQFMVNEYIAACWGVACDVKTANLIEKDIPAGDPFMGHQSQYCGQFDHQHVLVNGTTNTAHGMEEVKSAWGGALKCTVYTDATYTTQRAFSSIKDGDTIYWITEASGNVYHHVGTVSLTNTSKPNHS